MSSTSKARITIFQLPTSPEFAKRVNLYADPDPCIKTFRRADFLSFIMIHQKLLFASHPRRKTSTKLPTSFSKQERIPHPREIIFERRANSPLLSSPDIGLDTSHFESGHQCQDENSNNVSRRGGGSSTPRSARIGTSSGNKTRWCLSREKGSRRWKIRRAIYNFRSTFENSRGLLASRFRVLAIGETRRRLLGEEVGKIGSLEGFGFVWKALEYRGQDIV